MVAQLNIVKLLLGFSSGHFRLPPYLLLLRLLFLNEDVHKETILFRLGCLGVVQGLLAPIPI